MIRCNQILQRYLNPADPCKKEHACGNAVFREGDKVMQIKNNYQLEWEIVGRYNIPIDKGLGVFNGDMGRIREINDTAATLTVEFDDGRRVNYPFSGLEEPMRLYPVLVNAFLLWAFGTTLLPNRMPMVERFARMKDSVLPPEAVRWCRGVTQVWCGFFILNGAAALATVFLSRETWVLWNGCLSYIAIGVLFAGEWLLRTLVMHRREGRK